MIQLHFRPKRQWEIEHGLISLYNQTHKFHQGGFGTVPYEIQFRLQIELMFRFQRLRVITI